MGCSQRSDFLYNEGDYLTAALSFSLLLYLSFIIKSTDLSYLGTYILRRSNLL